VGAVFETILSLSTSSGVSCGLHLARSVRVRFRRSRFCFSAGTRVVVDRCFAGARAASSRRRFYSAASCPRPSPFHAQALVARRFSVLLAQAAAMAICRRRRNKAAAARRHRRWWPRVREGGRRLLDSSTISMLLHQHLMRKLRRLSSRPCRPAPGRPRRGHNRRRHQRIAVSRHRRAPLATPCGSRAHGRRELGGNVRRAVAP
jgi:hypothetical protein